MEVDQLHRHFHARLVPGLGARTIATHVIPLSQYTDALCFSYKGWLITWASLQASLLTTDHHARQILSPRVANALFVVLGLSLLTVSTVMAAINIMGGNALWHGYTVIEAGLKKFEREWVPGESELPKIVTLLPELNGLMNSAGYYQK